MTITGDNIAADTANVGVQAQVVHGDVWVYQLSGDSAEEQYRIGVNYLDGGVPAKAREYIGSAVARGYLTSEVSFHWLLALLSGRTLRQFTAEELQSLNHARKRLPRDVSDEWDAAADVINCLIDLQNKLEIKLASVMEKLDRLGTVQKDKIFRHLEGFFIGPIQEQIWSRAVEQLRGEQMNHARSERAWLFFEPEPAGARVRWPDPVQITAADRFVLASSATVLAGATGYLAWLLVDHRAILAILILLLTITASPICFMKGLDWRHQVERRRSQRIREYQPAVPRPRAAAPGKFANSVDRLVNHYFALYLPPKTERAAWLTETARIRRGLRDEVSEIYREKRVKAEQVAWLIRYEASEAKRRKKDAITQGELGRASAPMMASFVLLCAIIATGIIWVMQGLAHSAPLEFVILAATMAGSGPFAVRSIMWIALERRRFSIEVADCKDLLKNRKEALTRWQEKLAGKPTDTEMASWLACDRTILVDQLMRHYRLPRSQIIAHAFIEAPADSSNGARVFNGPWRYSRYTILVFLLTIDGVRQVTADLDFQKGIFRNAHRMNYRFDALASVQVTETVKKRQTFELSLVNGQSIAVTVVDDNADQLLAGEDSEELSAITLDVTGLTNAFHILEGVAAEGKGWIKPGSKRLDKRFRSNLASPVDSSQD